MARFALLLLIVGLAGCELFQPKPIYVRAKPPAAIYDCKPDAKRPHFVAIVNGEETYYALDSENTRLFKVMVLQTEACLKGWRDWSSK